MRLDLRLHGVTETGIKCRADVSVYAGSQRDLFKHADIAAKTAALGLGGVMLFANCANAAEIHAMVTGALTGAFRQLVPQFESESGHKVDIAWGPSSGTSKDALLSVWESPRASAC